MESRNPQTNGRHVPQDEGEVRARNARDRDEREMARQQDTPLYSFRIVVSFKFIVTALAVSMILAFLIGRGARTMLLLHQDSTCAASNLQEPLLPQGKQVPHSEYTTIIFDTARTASSSTWLTTSPRGGTVELSPLVTRQGEEIPPSRYSGKNFDNTKSDCHSEFLKTSDGKEDAVHMDTIFKNMEKEDDIDEENDSEDDDDSDDDEEEEVPKTRGAHLMVDIKNVEAAFLNSEKRLADAMLQVVNESGLALLSYHCHSIIPSGVTCVGILLRNYVAFHTWPEDGVITLDLFSSGSMSLLSPTLPAIRKAFGVPRDSSEPPRVRWAQNLRGFRSEDSLSMYVDLSNGFLPFLGYELKERVASVETNFQTIDIFDMLDPQTQNLADYERSLSGDGSYQSRHPRLFEPYRVVMLDGMFQSNSYEENAYHESLVHPAMFAHTNPKRVAIVGGGEGATLREVLKHNTVEEVIMIEIDEVMVNVSREHLPQCSDCSDLVDSADCCMDDPRAKMYYEDAFAWFLGRYSSGNESSHEKFDVVIVDALDPESEIPFAEMLYDNERIARAFYDSLSDDGVLVMQLGESSYFGGPDETHSAFKNRAATVGFLEELPFESIHTYEESHCGFDAPWTFVIGFRTYSTRRRWFTNAAEVDLEMHKRGRRTKSGLSPFHYFDGATMEHYQTPSRLTQDVFCRRSPTPAACVDDGYILNPAFPEVPSTSFEVRPSGVGSKVGRGLFAKVDIPKDAYLDIESDVNSIVFMPSTFETIEALGEEESAAALDLFEYYMDGYGFISHLYGGDEVVVDSGIQAFVNHGCRGTNNIGLDTPYDEFTADVNAMPPELDGKGHAGTFNPLLDRHLLTSFDITVREIHAGDEILENYLAFLGGADYWAEGVTHLRNQCAGKESGMVREYESWETE